MKEALAYLSIIFVIASCNSNKQSASDEMPPLYPPPITVRLNTEEGYIINPVTGDSIHPIINSLGDTIKTGVPVPAIGKTIHPDSVAQPKIIPVGEPEVVPTHMNVHKIPESLTIIPVNKDSLKTFTPGVDTSSHVLVNTTGDTVPTGVPIPVVGKVVPCRLPQPVKALPQQIIGNARFNIKYLDMDQGMNSSHVQSIMEDSHGNLWFGTMLGLSRYNGETFTHFTEKEGLSNNRVRSVMEDNHGNIWIGTAGGGVNMYDGESFTYFTEKEGLSNNFVLPILEDSRGNLWFGTWGGGVCMYNNETFTHFTEKEGLSSDYIRSILEDSHGNLWFGTTDGGVNMYNGTTFTHFTEKEDLSNNHVVSMLEDSHGNIWFATHYGGVNMYNGETFTHFTINEGLSNNTVPSIMEDSHGNIWIGTDGGGVNMYNGETFTHYTEYEGLSDNSVQSILEDSHGNLWFGTWGGGVSIYKGETFPYFTPEEFIIKHSIRPVIEDSHGNFWFGTAGGGVSMYDGETFTYFTQEEDLLGDPTRCIIMDNQGNLWFGNAGRGVSMYNGRTFTQFTEKEGLSSNHVRSMLEDSHGNIWVGTWGGGVSMYNGETFTHFTEKEGFSNNIVWSIIEDSHGNIWFGTKGGGASKYNGETLTHYTEKEGLSNNTVYSILEDSHGNLWFGTEGGGVNMFDGESFTYFTEKEGLSNNYIWSILEDRNSNIWLSTAKGLSCILFDPDVKRENVKLGFNYPVIQAYSLQDGLKSMSVNNSIILDSKNRIWWGSDKYLTMLDMNNFKISTEPPVNMRLNSIDINDQYVDYRNLKDSARMKIEFDSIPRFYNYPLNLKLPYNRNHLTFHFSAIDWSAPHKIKYSYKLEGLKGPWSTPTAENKVDYRNLPSGIFTFKVRAIGSAQKWSDAFEYTFTIRPPWWFSWWAYIIYGLIFVLIIRQYRRYLLNRAKLQHEFEIERMEKEKLEELDHMRSRFFANISHEFRTPLTLLLGPLEDGLKIRKSIIETDRGVFEMMRRNIKRLQRLINQLLDLSKLETGKIKLQVSEGNLTEFVRTIVLSFLSLAESKKIEYEYELSEILGPVYFDQDKLDKILTNLVSNAFKFTSPEGNIKILLNYIVEEEKDTPVFAKFSIVDSGHGIPADQIEKIFDRFYQADSSDSNEHEGTGIGLALTKELVDLYQGEINVESELGKGSTFNVKLPVAKVLFKEDEIVTDSSGKQPAPIEGIIDTAEPEKSELQEADTGLNEDLPTILIVEDNPDLRKYISQSLLNEFQILKAENGREGMSKAFEDIPDLVITDLMMPEMDGIEMCERIINDERTSHIPIIMLTAKADRDSKLEGLKTGADDYLIKPFDAEELRVRTRNLIEQRRKLREKFRNEIRIKPLEQTVRIPRDKLLRKVLEILSQNIDDPQYNVNHLPGKLNMSRSQMFKKINALTGSGPKELLRIMRLKKAAELMLTGKQNITRIMYEVGFQTPSHFAQSFREYFGVNPSQYKKSKNY